MIGRDDFSHNAWINIIVHMSDVENVFLNFSPDIREEGRRGKLNKGRYTFQGSPDSKRCCRTRATDYRICCGGC